MRQVWYVRSIVLGLIMTSLWLYAQEERGSKDNKGPVISEGKKAIMIEGWADLRLGMTYEEVLKVLLAKLANTDKPWLRLKNPPNSEIIEERELYTLELLANDYIEEGFLQFNSKRRLYLIRLLFDKRYFSYLSLKRQLELKYGKPTRVRYEDLRWQKDGKRLILDRSRMVRYVDDEFLPKKKLPISESDKRRQKMIRDILESL